MVIALSKRSSIPLYFSFFIGMDSKTILFGIINTVFCEKNCGRKKRDNSTGSPLFAAGFFNFTIDNSAKADEQYPGRMKHMFRFVEE